jgi:hypothetical protein
MTPKRRLAIHCHHDTLVEWCWDYDERVRFIETEKPANERATRLRLFKLLPPEALADLSTKLQQVHAEMVKGDADLDKANNDPESTTAARLKARATRDTAMYNWHEEYGKWPKRAQKAWHARWCGCMEWDGREIRFHTAYPTGVGQ